MKVSLEQASGILNRTPDEVLYIANNEQRLEAIVNPDDDIIYNDDGTVQFVDGKRDPVWEFELDEVLAFKKEMDEGLVGKVEEILDDPEEILNETG